MFKYIGYDLRSDTFIATNDITDWILTCGHVPQISQYFSSFKEAIEWLEAHPSAHEDFLKEEEREFEDMQMCGICPF